MSFTAYQNGGGGTTGDEVAVNAPLYVGTGGHLWYVGPGGVDSGARGKERERPLLTTAQAVSNASAGDVIIYLPNFTEAISAPIAVNKNLTIVSESTGSTRARLTCAGTIAMFTLSVTGTSFNNIFFPASTAVPTVRVDVTAPGIVMDNCWFECGANDTNRTVRYNTGVTGSCQLTHAMFVAVGSQPAIGVEVAVAAAGMFFEEVTFDGGSFGFSDFAFKGTGLLTGMYANKIHQLNNADVQLTGSWTGVWIPGNVSLSARFEG